MGLLLPPKVEREIQKDKWVRLRAEQRALADRVLDFEDPVCREWQPAVRGLDPMLRLARARPQAYVPGMNVKPGYYHWVRDNSESGAGLTIEPITGPDGESFTEPDSGFFERLRGNDLRDPRVFAALIADGERIERDRERDLANDREQLNAEVVERFKAKTDTTVSMSGRWSQNTAGKKGRKA